MCFLSGAAFTATFFLPMLYKADAMRVRAEDSIPFADEIPEKLRGVD